MKIVKERIKNTGGAGDPDLETTVSKILEDVKINGDSAIVALSKQFDKVSRDQVNVDTVEIKHAYQLLDTRTIEHFKFAVKQITAYAQHQRQCLQAMEFESETLGVTLGHRLVPVETCGCYIPGGRYPLPSSAFMSILTAKIAGVKNVYAACPPDVRYGTINPAVLVAMDMAGADKIFCMGGAQAVGAFAFGTASVGKVDLIVGPGNRFVNEAKRQVIGTVGIDSLAGPSEVLIIADESASAQFVAIDLLAQCEHDPNASGILVTTSQELIRRVELEIETLVKELPTGKTAYQAWSQNGRIMLVNSLEEAVNVANEIAPEHLEVQTSSDQEVASMLNHYGSLFIGAYTPVTFGDYCSGTNHILPTSGTARYSNGVWVGTFIKTAFYQSITQEGCKNLSETCRHLATLEGLCAHEKSVAVRVEN
jgi:sulfopropanediol 3-dehydrogenase